MKIMVSSSSILLITIFSIGLLISCSESKEYIVGDGKKSWRFPLPSFHAFTNWASTHHQFTIGDTIVFEYDRTKESVHEVDEHDYIKCNTRGHNNDRYYGGNTKIVLDRLGVRYFISGRKGHCKMGLKVAVITVMPSSSPPSPSPSP
ncbi:early nodulin-16-like [Trifolium pratense]|uniref:early nodulin-16-like n=1 Tax=Trifolium pratense TaxID=57577 RepID=UPI001E692889|nr:early nodulin-16-like [Trifolium pratense]